MENQRRLRTINLGHVPYEEALALQKAIQRQRIEGQCDDTLLLLEHEPVLTKGIRTSAAHILGSEEALAAMGVKVYESNRGGDVTYLGPGQVVGYIIMNIDGNGRDIRRVVQKMEQVTINILEREFGLHAHREDKKYTGVFVDTNKITAMGLAVNRRVTMHGFAMNVNTNLSHFDWLIPCGLHDRGVTSVERLTGKAYDLEKMKRLIVKEFETLFETTTYEISKTALLATLKEGNHEDEKPEAIMA